MTEYSVVECGSNESSRAPLSTRRIALIISNLEYGGAQRQVVALANSLSKRNIAVHLITLSSIAPLAVELTSQVAWQVIGKEHKYDVTVVTRLAKYLRQHAVDLIHSFLFDAEIAARVAARLAQTRVVLGSERNTDYAIKGNQRLAYWATKKLRHGCIANSKAGALFNAQALGYPERHYQVVYNGVDSQRFRTMDRSVARTDLGLDYLAGETFLIGIFGSFKQQKNHQMFLRTARLILDAGYDVHFLIVGDELAGGTQGSNKNKTSVVALLHELQLEDRCIFLGNRGDLEAVYPACNVTVLSSRYEGMPNVAIEAMACGVPVVATGVSDNAIIIPHGQCGFIVDVDDDADMCRQICKLIDEPSLCSQLGRQARNWVTKEFSIAKLANNTIRAYEYFLDAAEPASS